MNPSTKRILGLNLVALLLAAGLARLANSGPEAGLGYMFMMAFVVFFLTVLNLVGVAFARGRRKDFLLGLLLVLLIGFGACLGGAATY